ncbi:hypothetical protein J6590_038029 [Homalodisca vitripennis]|nr:hypothetical protein J6590_038029 [Homalodisca vitripennis]
MLLEKIECLFKPNIDITITSVRPFINLAVTGSASSIQRERLRSNPASRSHPSSTVQPGLWLCNHTLLRADLRLSSAILSPSSGHTSPISSRSASPRHITVNTSSFVRNANRLAVTFQWTMGLNA